MSRVLSLTLAAFAVQATHEQDDDITNLLQVYFSRGKLQSCREAMENSMQVQGIYVVPSLKLAYCPFPKVGSTDMALLFDELNGLGPVSDLGSCQVFPHVTTLNINVADVSRANGWRFAYIARDPLERYLSAFLSKCGPNGAGVIPHDGARCFGPLMPLDVTPEGKIALFEQRVMLDAAAGSPADDQHWVRQSDILSDCAKAGFSTDAVDFKGEMTKDTQSTHNQVKALLEMAGARDVEGLVSRYFPAGAVAGHHNQEQEPADFFHNVTVVAAALSLYEEDYTKLGLPLPDYVAKVLGEAAATHVS